VSTKRILVTGGGGFVAGSVIAQSGPDTELHAVSRGNGLTERPGVCWHSTSLDDLTGWEALFDAVRPDAVIHTAAIADIDYCQANPTDCRRVNVEFTRQLARLCAAFETKLVFCSTDTIFDGEHAPYCEIDPPDPVNIYAESKVDAEKAVVATTPRHVIARIGLVLGLPVLGTGNSFVAKLLVTLRTGRSVAVPANEIRTPVDVITLGRALLELATGSFVGVIHLAGNDRVSRLEINRGIAARFGFPADQIQPGPSVDVPGRARRPRDVSLNNARARAELRTPMLNFDSALELALGSVPITETSRVATDQSQ